MKQIVITLLAVCFAVTAHAQFIYDIKQESFLDKKLASIKRKSITPTKNLILGVGNNEFISVLEIASGHIFKDERDRLAFGGTIAKSDSKVATDMKTLLQGGGNFFLNYLYPILPGTSNNDRNFFLLLFRTKIGAILPGAGKNTDIIQASFDPGFELLFSVATLQKEISITGSVRSSLLWTSKDFSDATGFNKNLIPYHFITGGVKVKSFGSIVYSQSFLSSSLSTSPLPKASIGLSVSLE
jgi:hypothetical protein